MSVPPVDKIHEVPDDVWDILLQGFLSPELLRGLDIPVLMDERAIEEFEKWSDDENEVVSSTTTSEEAALIPVTQTRFRTVTSDELETAVKMRIPKGTQKSTNWGMNVWCAWCDEQNVEMSSDRMNSLLNRFVQEATRQDGKPYPPSSLYNIVAAIQRFLREKGRPNISFFDVKAPEFDLLRKSLDARMKELTSEGVGVEKQSAQPLTKEMEEILWDKKIFTPETGID